MNDEVTTMTNTTNLVSRRTTSTSCEYCKHPGHRLYRCRDSTIPIVLCEAKKRWKAALEQSMETMDAQLLRESTVVLKLMCRRLRECTRGNDRRKFEETVRRHMVALFVPTGARDRQPVVRWTMESQHPENAPSLSRPKKQKPRKIQVALSKRRRPNKMDVCPICLETPSFLKTQCGHAFCHCLLQVVFAAHAKKEEASCPYCRGDIYRLTFLKEDAYLLLKSVSVGLSRLNFVAHKAKVD